jgi:curli biogenesis system outer membrane secretion channel CsgG
MKSFLTASFTACLFMTSVAAFAGTKDMNKPVGKPVIAVAEFKNETSAGWWNSSIGWELSSLLSNELAATDGFRVVERQKLQSVMEEQNLMASGRAKLSNAAQMGKLFGADYLVMGTVTSYEEQTKNSGGGMSFGGISLGSKGSEAYVAIDVRVVNSSTGEIAFTRTIEGTSKSGGSSMGISKFGFSGDAKSENNKPAGKAIRAAVVLVSDYLDCVMVRKDGCEAAFQQQDQRRRKKTSSALSID